MSIGFVEKNRECFSNIIIYYAHLILFKLQLHSLTNLYNRYVAGYWLIKKLNKNIFYT